MTDRNKMINMLTYIVRLLLTTHCISYTDNCYSKFHFQTEPKCTSLGLDSVTVIYACDSGETVADGHDRKCRGLPILWYSEW